MSIRFATLRGVTTPWGRFFAGVSASLILLLVLGGVCPEIHDHLCPDHHGGSGSDHCVIYAFAAGEGYAAVGGFSMVVPGMGHVWAIRTHELVLALETSAYRWLPICGPPKARLLSS